MAKRKVTYAMSPNQFRQEVVKAVFDAKLEVLVKAYNIISDNEATFFDNHGDPEDSTIDVEM